ncbi:MAG TPA: T9SS type A sorting domain-containing protein, partial [Chitinophagaceae bacterium]
GGLNLQVNMTDRGEPGLNDDIAISLWNGNTLLYSSNWIGNNTGLMLLAGGNLLVHSGFSLGAPVTNAARNSEEIQQALPTEVFEVKVFGNPTQREFSMITETTSSLPISIKVMDVSGRIVGRQDNVRSGQLVRFGNNYKIGTYFAEIIQGDQRKVITLIKQ